MIISTSSQSPDGRCVDAARDSMYCLQDHQHQPKAAPRTHPPVPKPRSVLPTGQCDSTTNTTTKRLIKVDFSLFEDEDQWNFTDIDSLTSKPATTQQQQQQQSTTTCSQQPLISHVTNNENNPNNINTTVVYRRKKDAITHDEYHRFCDNALESYDLATQCESRRTSMRRHTIVGCQSNTMECQSTPSSRPESRQSSDVFTNPLNPLNPLNAAIIDEWTRDTVDSTSTCSGIMGETINSTALVDSSSSTNDRNLDLESCSDRLALTLEEIVHIRSVITKAELEGLPVGVRVKEEVERKKICFLCLRTRFRLFQWGVQCRLCKRTVCSKCCSKMRIPTQHFKNVPVVLLSPSLMSSPVGSAAASPMHHAHILTSTGSGPSSIVDESFPKSLMERLLRSETIMKANHHVPGSVPSSPKVYHSTSSTPGVNGSIAVVSSGNQMTQSMGGLPAATISSSSNSTNTATISSNNNTNTTTETRTTNRDSIMSRSMEGPRSLPPQSPARPHSNSSTLDRRISPDQKELMSGEMMNVCNDCRGLVFEIIRSSKQTRSSARNKALRNLTLDLSPVYKRW